MCVTKSGQCLYLLDKFWWPCGIKTKTWRQDRQDQIKSLHHSIVRLLVAQFISFCLHFPQIKIMYSPDHKNSLRCSFDFCDFAMGEITWSYPNMEYKDRFLASLIVKIKTKHCTYWWKALLQFLFPYFIFLATLS